MPARRTTMTAQIQAIMAEQGGAGGPAADGEPVRGGDAGGEAGDYLVRAVASHEVGGRDCGGVWGVEGEACGDGGAGVRSSCHQEIQGVRPYAGFSAR